jgi:transcription elongation factor GreA
MADEKSYYLTKEGLMKIQKEYEDLMRIKHTKTIGETPKILHSEDVDPEYLAYQEDLSLLDIKLAELENILKNTKIINTPSKAEQGFINLGATVMVSIGGEEDEFTIVGTLEANPAEGKISNESPVGRQLLGKKAGDEVTISSPHRTVYKIKKIKYSTA